MKRQKIILKKILLIGVFLLLGAQLNTTVEASDSKDYGGNGSVGFYGEYVFPDDKEEPDKPDRPDLPSTGNEQTSTSKPLLKRLPQTGENQSSVWLIATGSILLMGTTILVFKKRKEEI